MIDQFLRELHRHIKMIEETPIINRVEQATLLKELIYVLDEFHDNFAFTDPEHYKWRMNERWEEPRNIHKNTSRLIALLRVEQNPLENVVRKTVNLFLDSLALIQLSIAEHEQMNPDPPPLD